MRQPVPFAIIILMAWVQMVMAQDTCFCLQDQYDNSGFMKGEKPMCREECIWPALMVLMRSTIARTVLTLA